jgi:protein-L-isoaspartate(D-aspartate) O-methyltransferase
VNAADELRDCLQTVDAVFARTAARTGIAAPDPRVRLAMAAVPRERFVPPHLRHRAYEDSAVAIGCGQTVSQPFMVALMTTLLRTAPEHRILEIGTGSGYQTAVLSHLVCEVYSVEIVPELAATARRTLFELGCDNVHVRWADGSLGWPEHAPYDGILVTAAGPRVPEALPGQLRPGGRLVVPVGPPGDQRLLVLRKGPDGRVETADVLPVVFVPLTGAGAR